MTLALLIPVLQLLAFCAVFAALFIQRRINARVLEMIEILRKSIDILDYRTRVATTQSGDKNGGVS